MTLRRKRNSTPLRGIADRDAPWRAAWLGMVPALICSCASEASRLIELDTVPFSALVSVECAAGDTATDHVKELIDRFQTGLADALKSYRTLSDVRVAAGAAEDPDADIKILVSLGTPKLKYVGSDGGGVVWNFLSWSTVPPVSLWVPAVEYDLGLRPEVKVAWASAEAPDADEAQVFQPEEYPRIPSYSTSLVDRVDFISNPWPYLGCLILPPFVYSGADEAHLEEELWDSFLADFSFWLAKEVKTRLQPDELALDDKITVELVSCEIPATSGKGKVWLRARLPAEEHFTVFEVWANDVKTATWRQDASLRDQLIDFSKRCQQGQLAEFQLEGLEEGENHVHVRASDYSQKDASFTFVVRSGTTEKPESDISPQPAAASEVKQAGEVSPITAVATEENVP